ncbi:MAG: AI-2E family transporter [Lachnospiraceae bacterium]|nr:AI-2E family transporter [Lachnospiraceae bacterium]
MKDDKKSANRLTWALFKAAALSILLFFLISRLDVIRAGADKVIGVLMPFIIGGVIAHVLKPMRNFFERHLKEKLPRQAHALSVVLALVVAVLAVGALLLMVIPSLFQSIYTIALMIPDSLQSASDWLLIYFGDNEVLSNYISELSGELSATLTSWLSGSVLPGLQALIGSVATGVGSLVTLCKNFAIGIIVAIYLLMGRKKFAEQGKKLLRSIFKKKWSDAILEEFSFADKMFSGFIGGRIYDSLIIGVICFVGMLILRIPYPGLVSVIVGVTNIIPFFGPFIGAVPSFLLILIVKPVKALIFLVFVVILQQFDGNILGPRILGNVTGLSSFWVLFSILFFGGIFGFVGMLIGVPVFAVIYDVVRKLVNKGLNYRERQEAEAGGQAEGAKGEIRKEIK